MRDNTPPPGFCDILRGIFGLDFTPIPFSEKRQFAAALARRGVAYGPWVNDLWAEYRVHDSVLAHDGKSGIYRLIRTLAVVVKRERRDPKTGVVIRECLTGRVELPDGTVVKRRYANSLSEKFRWRKGFDWQYKFTAWRLEVLRAIYEELKTRLPRSVLYRIKLASGKDEDDRRFEVDIRPNDPSRPGITTCNLLLRAEFLLPERYWKDEYREEWREGGHLVKTVVHTWVPDMSNE